MNEDYVHQPRRLAPLPGLIAALLAALLGSATASPAAAQGGTITGVVVTTARPPAPIRVSFDQRVCGQELPDQSVLVGAGGGLANAVVSLSGVKSPSPVREVQVVNDHCAFVPRVQVASPGASVRTSSRDAVLHTTVLQHGDGRQIFNVALPVPGIEITKPLPGPGVFRVGCSTHQWMRAWIVVTDDHSAVTNGDGRFTLANVPAGRYELRFWHESLKTSTQTVEVKAGQTTELRIEAR